MSLARPEIDEVLAAVAREGDVHLSLAPTDGLGRGCPLHWRNALASEQPASVSLAAIWGPMASRLPKTLASLARVLCGIGYLTTAQRPPSLLYFYRAEGQVFAYRGYAPTILQRPESRLIPPEVAAFYSVHNGFVDATTWAMGPLPEWEWHYLSDNPTEPAGSFLVLFSNGGGASVGFDLSEDPVLSYTVWPDDPPDLVHDFWGALDDWMASGLKSADPT